MLYRVEYLNENTLQMEGNNRCPYTRVWAIEKHLGYRDNLSSLKEVNAARVNSNGHFIKSKSVTNSIRAVFSPYERNKTNNNADSEHLNVVIQFYRELHWVVLLNLLMNTRVFQAESSRIYRDIGTQSG